MREMTTSGASESVKTQALLDFGRDIDPRELFPSLEDGATDFALQDPYAFALAVCLDRGTKADIIWTIPYYIKQRLGHLDPYKINRMNQHELSALFNSLARRPRYVDAAPRTVQELTAHVIGRFGGDASRMWRDKKAAEVQRNFQNIYGVGPGISSMAVLLIEKAYGIRFSDLDRKEMNIKPDVHTMRVLFRLGLSSRESEGEAVATARRLHPAYPGELDAPLWVIGRRWCHYSYPRCPECRMNEICPKIGV
jgi:endonuclease III